jgi:hypothetical protein
VTVIELLELHAERATRRPWRQSEDGELLADIEAADEDERTTIELYGGWPVAESMTDSDAGLVALAVNHLPEFLALVRAAKRYYDWIGAVNPRHAEDDKFRAALEPLFREVPS